MTVLNPTNGLLALHGSSRKVDPQWTDKLGVLRLDDPDHWSRFSEGEVASASKSTNCFRVKLVGGESVFFKRYVFSSWRLRSLFMPSKAMAEAWGLNEMAAVGCRTPELLALGERRLLGNVRAACVVTRAIENAVSLAEFAEQQRELRRTNPQQWSHWIKQISAQLIPQMQAMHRAGLYHYDLKWRNLLLVQHGSDCEIHLIDCPRARRHRWRRFRGQVVDLSALSRLAITHLSQHQRLRFLLQYLGKNYNRNHARKLLKAVNAHLSRRPPAGW